MTHNEIIEMARQAGWPDWEIVNMKGELKLFAKLIAAQATAKEREEIAKLVEPDTKHRNRPYEYLGGEEGVLLLDGIAEAIRARGEA